MVLYRPVPGYADLYASMDGTIVLAGHGELTQRANKRGYLYVHIPGVGTRYVHSLVALAYLGVRPMNMQVRHGDHDKSNCSVGNFCYGTPQQNTHDSILNGTHVSVINSRKTECPQGHLYDNPYIDPASGWRQCPICRKIQVRGTEERHRQVVQANGRHLTLEEKRTIAYELLSRPKPLPDRAIARRTGLTHTTIARFRRNITSPAKTRS